MDRSVDYYMNLPYTIELQHDPEEGWFVRVKELRGCMSQGDTAEEAIAMIREAMELWLEVALEDGLPIPEPRPEEGYSGKFVVRVPRSLHRDLVENAAREGVSLNQYINVALARAVSRPGPPDSIRAEETGWPGLQSAVRQVLVAAGYDRDAGELDERLLASWFEQCLAQVQSALQGGYFRDALQWLDALAYQLKAGVDKSPVLSAFYQTISLLRQQVETTVSLQQGVTDIVMLRAKIGQFVRTANQPLAHAVIQEERIAYSETSTERTIPGAYLGQWSEVPRHRSQR